MVAEWGKVNSGPMTKNPICINGKKNMSSQLHSEHSKFVQLVASGLTSQQTSNTGRKDAPREQEVATTTLIDTFQTLCLYGSAVPTFPARSVRNAGIKKVLRTQEAGPAPEHLIR